MKFLKKSIFPFLVIAITGLSSPVQAEGPDNLMNLTSQTPEVVSNYEEIKALAYLEQRLSEVSPTSAAADFYRELHDALLEGELAAGLLEQLLEAYEEKSPRIDVIGDLIKVMPLDIDQRPMPNYSEE